jgi:hypothetical protein
MRMEPRRKERRKQLMLAAGATIALALVTPASAQTKVGTVWHVSSTRMVCEQAEDVLRANHAMHQNALARYDRLNQRMLSALGADPPMAEFEESPKSCGALIQGKTVIVRDENGGGLVCVEIYANVASALAYANQPKPCHWAEANDFDDTTAEQEQVKRIKIQQTSPNWTHRLSAKCAEEITQHRATPECEQEGKQWSRELDQKLADPAWRQDMMDWAEKNHVCVSVGGCQ